MDATRKGLNIDLLYNCSSWFDSLVPSSQPEPDGDLPLAGLHVGVVARPLKKINRDWIDGILKLRSTKEEDQYQNAIIIKSLRKLM